MKILSLFDWMSCWQIAINKLWITDYTYYASEIDKYAIQVTQHNYPNTIQVWDVTWIEYKNNCLKTENTFMVNERFDLLIWWSPCQWFSFAGKQLNFEDERSKLFFEFVRILKEVKPKYFLLENVKMKKEFQDVISEYLYWVNPIEINSSLVSAQNRKRLYWVWELQEDWTYKKVEIEQPEDRKIYLKDIIENEVDKWYFFSEDIMNNLKKYESNSRLSPLDLKSSTLNTMQWWHRQPKICAMQVWQSKNFWNAWGSDKGYTIKTNTWHWVMWENYIRKLTPLECERLQTVPDNYTSIVSNSQRYKMLWNWWTVDVIVHILSNLFLNL